MTARYTNMKRDVLVLHLDQRLGELTSSYAGKSIRECTDEELYSCMMKLCKEVMAVSEQNEGEKKIYYISAEFLVGQLMGVNMINMGIYDRMKEILAENGRDLERILELEPEPSLGNGGLGRLAACFMDSIATLGLPGEGIGLFYHYGLFRQIFQDHKQKEEKDPWITEDSWAVRTDVSYNVSFGDRKVTSRMYEIDVPGYESGVNRLRLFDLEGVDESLVREGISFDKEQTDKNLTLFLYPDDSDEAGNLLRIYQQYFMVSNAAQLILDDMKKRKYDLHRLDEHAVIQINDTHPTMIIPELIRLLVEEKAFTMEEAAAVVSRTCAYTNHTILAEALETWPMEYLEKAVPQLVPVIRYLDRQIREKYSDPAVQIIDENNRVHMAFIDIHYGFSVNGVAAIHTDILKREELHAFYELYPEKFNNKTNGISFRRFLYSCNPELTALVTGLLGEGVRKDAGQLERLLEFRDDQEVLTRLEKIKQQSKKRLAAYVQKRQGAKLNPEGIFDVQIKRLHEYKRQQMNALYIIHKYLEIKSGTKPVRPVNYIFGAKAAPAYIIAKDIIHLLLVLQEIIEKDPEVSPYMYILFTENYNVSYAEKLIPAADISEQVSLASKEASGTGNMKMMLNGAVTIGTADGANVEIRDLVGEENIYMFGADAQTVIERYEKNSYDPGEYYRKSAVIREAVDFITGEQAMSVGCRENLERLYRDITTKDYFMALSDLEDYIRVKDQMFADYEDRAKWNRMMLVNIAKTGFFSSDRTIAEYERDIWKLR